MSVVYNGEHSIDFWNLNDQEALCVNSWDDLHLIPASRPYVVNPEVMLQSVNIPNTNRRIDLTASLTEGRTYNSRQGEWEFIIDHDKWPDWATCYRHLVQYFHGFKMAARLKDHDLERMYKGRISVQSYAPNNDYSRIVLRYIFESGRVTDPFNLNLSFEALWLNVSGDIIHSSIYSWNEVPSWDSAPAGIVFQPPYRPLMTNQIYKEKDMSDEWYVYDGNIVQSSQFANSNFYNFSGSKVRTVYHHAFYQCKNLLRVYFPTCSYVGSYTFDGCSSLVSANFPTCSYVGSYAFRSCSSLVSANFPACSYVGSYAFRSCSSLVSVSFPACSYVGDGAFWSCSSLVSVSFPVCGIISERAFMSCASLISASFPVCSYVGGAAFRSCSTLVSVSFPACSYIDNGAFYNCSSLVSVSFPVCSYVGSYAFNGCSSLVSVSFPVCSYVGSYAFNGCSSLVSVSFPVCNYVDRDAFDDCSSLVSASFPACSYVGNSAFWGCSSLVSVSFQACSYVGNYAFYSCSSLVSVSFQACSYVGNYAFYSCSSLQYLTIGGSSVIPYNGGIGLGNTPMSAKSIWSSAISSYIYVPYPWTESNPIEFGSIYVPASLINDYMTASGWSAYSSRFAAI